MSPFTKHHLSIPSIISYKAAAACVVYLSAIGMCLGDDNSIDSLKAAYLRAATWEARRALCVDAIDRGVIKSGAPLKALVDALALPTIPPLVFGDPAAPANAVVFFEEQTHVHGRNDSPGFFFGWYLEIDAGTDGNIRRYRISNVHKRALPPYAD